MNILSLQVTANLAAIPQAVPPGSVSYTSVTYVAPLAAALTLILTLATVLAVYTILAKRRRERELQRQKLQLSDSSRRKKLGEGVIYAGTNPLVSSERTARLFAFSKRTRLP
jgi:hypothetical protein